jgi:hypothetical protein
MLGGAVLNEGSAIYLGFDDPFGDRVLYPGLITSIDQDRWTIEFENSEIQLTVGEERLVYYRAIKKFVQRLVRIEEHSETISPLRVAMKFIGDVVSVDTRHEYRVSAIDAGLSVALGGVEAYTVQDISMSGVGLISDRKHSIGDTLDMTIRFEEGEFSGPVVVQGIRELDDGRVRYGLRGLFAAGDGSPLRSGLTRTTLAVHRQHLRRSSGGD